MKGQGEEMATIFPVSLHRRDALKLGGAGVLAALAAGGGISSALAGDNGLESQLNSIISSPDGVAVRKSLSAVINGKAINSLGQRLSSSGGLNSFEQTYVSLAHNIAVRADSIRALFLGATLSNQQQADIAHLKREFKANSSVQTILSAAANLQSNSSQLMAYVQGAHTNIVNGNTYAVTYPSVTISYPPVNHLVVPTVDANVSSAFSNVFNQILPLMGSTQFADLLQRPKSLPAVSTFVPFSAVDTGGNRTASSKLSADLLLYGSVATFVVGMVILPLDAPLWLFALAISGGSALIGGSLLDVADAYYPDCDGDGDPGDPDEGGECSRKT